MTPDEILTALQPRIRFRLAKPIVVNGVERFAAGEIVDARLAHRDDYGAEIRVEQAGRRATAGEGDLEGAEPVTDEELEADLLGEMAEGTKTQEADRRDATGGELALEPDPVLEAMAAGELTVTEKTQELARVELDRRARLRRAQAEGRS